MKIRFHDVPDDIETMRIVKDREIRWNKLVNDYRENYNPWSMEQIGEVLHDIQEFAALDFPEQKIITVDQVRIALDNITRVALSLFEKLTIQRDNDPRHYITSKLCTALIFLEPKNEKQE